MRRWPLIIAVTMLIGTWALLETMSHGEPVPSKRPFSTFPLTLGDRWQGRELGLDRKVLDVLKLSDYMMRVYAPPSGGGAPVWLYVGYYESQRTGASYHSPKNCLPGAGWQFVESEEAAVTPVSGAPPIVINRTVIQKGLDRQVILYWYHDRGRVVASEYWAKGYLIWDAMTKNRTDGSLVRVSVPVIGTPDQAYQQGLAFLRDFWPVLQDYMPPP